MRSASPDASLTRANLHTLLWLEVGPGFHVEKDADASGKLAALSMQERKEPDTSVRLSKGAYEKGSAFLVPATAQQNANARQTKHHHRRLGHLESEGLDSLIGAHGVEYCGVSRDGTPFYTPGRVSVAG